MRAVQYGLVVLCLQGCLTDRARERGRDRDGDGHAAWQLDGSDCDDDNPAVNPDRPEVCGNGLDDDCDGLVDDNGEGALTWFFDADGDGFTGSGEGEGCGIPDGGVVEASALLDCDDGDSSINPNSTEIWYDGVDQNCDGNDQDQDVDGVPLSADCNDTDPNIRPGALEVCNNGLDDDCSGPLAGDCGFAVSQDFENERYTLLPGNLVLDIADQNQDGFDDLVLLRSSDSLLFRGPFESGVLRVLDADVRIDAELGFGCRFVWLFGDDVMSLACADVLGQRIGYASSLVGGSQTLSSLPTLVDSPSVFGQTGVGFGSNVFTANDMALEQSWLFVTTGQYESQFGSTVLDSGEYAYRLNTVYPMPASSERGGAFDLDFDVVSSRPLLLSESEQHIIIHEDALSGGQISMGRLVEGRWAMEPLVISSLGEVRTHSQPVDVNNDGELDFLSVATRPLSGGEEESLVSVHTGPFGIRTGLSIDVNTSGTPLIARNGAVEGGAILAAELCDVTGDGVPEIVLSVVGLVNEAITLDLWVHDVATGQPMFQVLSGGLIVGCSDFDGNGAEDIIATDVTQSWILYSDLD
ncbi:MAG: hypothetical protein ACJA00_004698 [Myxococcota bacterium]|jgi:hypothetical protein